MITDIANRPSGPVRIVWHDTETAGMPITGVHGFCFYEGAVLVCDIFGRGLTIPGGHVDEGETTVDCLIRETLEEACVELRNPKLIGFIEADHRVNAEYDGKYPVRSVQAIYKADVSAVNEFSSINESRDRRFVTVEELPSLHHEWNDVLQAALGAATDPTGR